MQVEGVHMWWVPGSEEIERERGCRPRKAGGPIAKTEMTPYVQRRSRPTQRPRNPLLARPPRRRPEAPRCRLLPGRSARAATSAPHAPPGQPHARAPRWGEAPRSWTGRGSSHISSSHQMTHARCDNGASSIGKTAREGWTTLVSAASMRRVALWRLSSSCMPRAAITSHQVTKATRSMRSRPRR